MRAHPTRPVIAGLLAAAACGGDPQRGVDAAPPADAAATQAVTLRFAAKVNGEALVCGHTYANVGTPATTYTPNDLRLFVHDVALITAAGARAAVTLAQDGRFQRGELALLDFETGGTACDMGTTATHTEITGSVAPGSYTGVSFKLGVPEAMNHLDASTAQPPQNDTTLWWVWRSGYRYLKIDGIGGAANPFGIHLGAIGCPGSSTTQPPSGPCAAANVAEIALTGFDAATNLIAVDLGAVLATSNLATNTINTAPGCLSDAGDPECDAIFPRLGLAHGSTPAATQVLFGVP